MGPQKVIKDDRFCGECELTVLHLVVVFEVVRIEICCVCYGVTRYTVEKTKIPPN